MLCGKDASRHHVLQEPSKDPEAAQGLFTSFHAHHPFLLHPFLLVRGHARVSPPAGSRGGVPGLWAGVGETPVAATADVTLLSSPGMQCYMLYMDVFVLRWLRIKRLPLALAANVIAGQRIFTAMHFLNSSSAPLLH